MTAAIPRPSLSVPPHRAMFSKHMRENVNAGEFVAIDSSPVIYIDLRETKNLTIGGRLAGKFGILLINLNYEASISGFDLPNKAAVNTAVSILSFFDVRKIKVKHLHPLSEGGIGFEFDRDGVYYNIKLDNEGDAVFYKEPAEGNPKGWDLTFTNLLRKLKAEF